MAHFPASLEQGLDNGERTRLIAPAGSGQNEKSYQANYFVRSALPICTIAETSQRRRRILARTFLVAALFLVGFTLLSDSNWAIERICHRNGLCSTDHMTPGAVLDAHPTAPSDILQDPNVLKKTPTYVLEYAPYVYLHSDEQFWPCSMASHLHHVTPEQNYTPIESKLASSLNLTNLDKLNAYERGRYVFLTSNDNVEDRPDWLSGAKNIPESFEPPKDSWMGKRRRAQGKGGRSGAPAVLITVDKGHGIVDAFWFFFYSYNLGNIVLNIRWGNHVGDWEHTMVRFQNGKPQVVFFSEHSFGSAYSYNAVEKIGHRPVVYSAIGTHAMYPTAGLQPYILPLGLLHDETSRGPLWDPALNLHAYSYSPPTDTLIPSILNPHSPTEWFFFNGKWGDKSYPLSDDRQYGLIGEYHYVNGPLGPRFKHLNRRKVCQGRYEDPCVIKHWLEAAAVPTPASPGEGEDWPIDSPELMPPIKGEWE